MPYQNIYLELTPATFTSAQARQSLGGRAELLPCLDPEYEFYRHWHDAVGKPWGWHRRRRINDRALIEATLERPDVEMFLLRMNDFDAGYSLVESHHPSEVEISDFGLLPISTGKGYGTIFLDLLLKHLWTRRTQKVWLATRSTNHPKVLDFYARFGFRVFDVKWIAGQIE